MSTQELRATFAAEVKKRTTAFFEQRVQPPAPTERLKTIADAIRNGNFGCATDGVTRLVSLIIEEDITALVKPPKYPHPDAGVMLIFLSVNLAPGKWVPQLILKDSGRERRGLHHLTDDHGYGLSDDQIQTAKQPTEQEIDEFFNQLSQDKLRYLLGMPFAADVLLTDKPAGHVEPEKEWPKT